MLPSFIFAIFASGSCGCSQSALLALFFRFLSTFANSSRVGVSMPLSFASLVRNSWYVSLVSRRTIERMAALASSVVASTPRVLPLIRS